MKSPSRSFVVMTYERCGGTYFAHLVGSTGCLGRPEDWFNGRGYRDRGEVDYPLDRAGQLQIVLERGRTDNGVVGTKLSPARVDELRGFDWHRQLRPNVFVHLVRTDRLARAISGVIAQQTRQYRSTSREQGKAVYDRDLIQLALAQQAIDEGRVLQYFAMHDITPLDLTYEELSSEPDTAVSRLAQALGITEPVQCHPELVELNIQRGETNRLWRETFLSQSSGPDIMEQLKVMDPLSRLRRRLTRIWR